MDPQLLEGVTRRDPAALSAMFERYFDQVFGLAFRLLGDRTLAEDLTQEVFLKIHRAAHQVDPTRDPTPWVVAITCNACRDVWRSRAYKMGRRSASVDAEPAVAAKLTPGTNDPERDLLKSEREKLVQEAIAELPEPLRECVVLHDYEGLNHQDIATLTGVNHAAARKRYSRALAALGKILKEKLG